MSRRVLDIKPLIYHYTSANVLPEFFKKGADLYCTNFRCLNDYTEITYGAFGFVDYLEGRNVLSREKADLLKGLIVEFAKDRLRDVWIMSFSEKGDDLAQWRGYVSNVEGGYAIGFNYETLGRAVMKLFAKTIQGQDTLIPYLSSCWYGGKDDLMIRSKYDFMYSLHKDSFDKFGKSLSRDCVNIESALDSIIVGAVNIKHPAFCDEKENRLILSMKGNISSRVRIIAGKPRLPIGLPRLKSPLHSYINRIYVSPHGKRNALVQQVEWLKRMCNGRFQIVESQIPYDPAR